MNFGEGFQLSERMSELGHTRVNSAEEADIVILNTCTVVETTEKKMIRRMSDLKKAGKEVIVTGCMAKVQSNRISIRLPDSIILPPDKYKDFSCIVTEKYGCTDHPFILETETFGIIPIAQGCLGNCTYCITKFARGKLISYPYDDILSQFNRMIEHGVREILITAQDTACYGHDNGSDLADLITKMLNTTGDYRIRIGMMNPNSLEPILDKLLDALDDPRVYKFFHIPVQSGSNDVLNGMKRHYRVEKFFSIVNRIRARYPDFSIATDIISGFPGETDEDHRKTFELIRTLRADTVNITRFSSRPGTEAAEMEPIHGRISKERSTELTAIKNETEYNINSKLIGKTFEVLITENGTNGSVIGRTSNYRPVALKITLPLGSFVNTEITDCTSTYLVGRVLNK